MKRPMYEPVKDSPHFSTATPRVAHSCFCDSNGVLPRVFPGAGSLSHGVLPVLCSHLMVVCRIGVVLRHSSDQVRAEEWLQIRLEGVCLLACVYLRTIDI